MLATLLVLSGCGRTGLVAVGGAEARPGVTEPSRATVPPGDGGLCPAHLARCETGGGVLCFDLQTSHESCGACGKQCPVGNACVAGKCRRRCEGKVTMREVAGPAGRGGPGAGMVLADLDRDGDVDLVGPGPSEEWAPPSTGATAGLHLNRGDGTFVTQATFPVGTLPFPLGWRVGVGDLNGDGIVDSVATGAAPDAVDVRLGTGDGSMLPPTALPMGGAVADLAVADVNADGQLDIAAALYQASALAVRFGRGDGSFVAPLTLPLLGSPIHLAVADWDGDGLSDLVANDDYLHIVRGLPDGSFAAALDCGIALSYHSKGGNAAPRGLIADFDQDGIVDLTIGNGVLFGMRGCSLTRRFDYDDEGTSALATGDFDGDGLPDLVVASSGLALLVSDGAGGFAGPSRLAGLEAGTYALAAGDLNDDGRLDLVVAGGDAVRVLINTCP